MKITVIGGGNIGTMLVGACLNKGHEVCIYTSKPDSYGENLTVVGDDKDLSYSVKLGKTTNNLAEAVADAEMILIAYPTFLLNKLADSLMPLIVEKDVILGIIPGANAEFAFEKYIRSGGKLFGLQRVPAVARLIKYGESVRVSGIRRELHLAAFPSTIASVCADFMSKLYSIPCRILPNYLNITLVPSNSVLHTGRLFAMFSSGKKYFHNPLFYEEWDDYSSDTVLALNDELQQTCRLLKEIDLSGVRSLREHYESKNSTELTKKIQSIAGFKGLLSPVMEVNGEYKPDFESRYFSADFPYGLGVVEEFAELAGANAENIKRVMDWYCEATKSSRLFRLSQYGFVNKGDIIDFYSL